MNNSNMCNLLSSPNSLQCISNTNIYILPTYTYSKNWSFPQLCARRAQGNPPNYIHPPSVGMVYPIQRYLFNWYIIPKCTFPQPCARRAQGNPPNYIHPPSVGMLYPIQRYLFNWYIIQKCTFPQPCARSAQWNPPNYIHPPRVGIIYPIHTYI